MRVIKAIGWELECGSDYHSDSIIRAVKKFNLKDCEVVDDGSVGVDGCQYCSTEIRLGGDTKSVIDAGVSLMENDYAIQNSSCGNHIHVFFTRVSDRKLWTWRNPQERFIGRYKRDFHENNKYLKRLTESYSRWIGYNLGEAIAGVKGSNDGSRYRAINMYSLRKHGSVEFRILPYFENAKEARKSIEWLLDAIIYITRTTTAMDNKDFGAERLCENFYDEELYQAIECNTVEKLKSPGSIEVSAMRKAMCCEVGELK